MIIDNLSNVDSLRVVCFWCFGGKLVILELALPQVFLAALL
jgi:hypothetical protein